MTQQIQALCRLGNHYYDNKNWHYAIWHYIKAYLKNLDHFVEPCKFRLRVSILRFCKDLINPNSKTTPEQLRNVVASVEVLFKKLPKAYWP